MKTARLLLLVSPHCTSQHRDLFVVLTVLQMCSLFAAADVFTVRTRDEGALGNPVIARDILVVLLRRMNRIDTPFADASLPQV